MALSRFFLFFDLSTLAYRADISQFSGGGGSSGGEAIGSVVGAVKRRARLERMPLIDFDPAAIPPTEFVEPEDEHPVLTTDWFMTSSCLRSVS